MVSYRSAQNMHVHRYDAAPGVEWEAVVRHASQSHLAESPEWYTIVTQTYRHRPIFLFAEDGSRGRAVLPAFLLRRWLLGPVLTSMPFLDAGGPCGNSAALARALVDRLRAEAIAAGAGTVEIRCSAPLDLAVPPSLEKVSSVLSLPADPDRLWRGLDPKVRNQVRKAERSGLSIETGGLERLDEFYRVFAVNMRDLGSPVHAKVFFEEILKGFGHAAQVVLVRKDAAPLGGLISLAFKDTLYVPWASSLREYASLCPNMLLYWETLCRACKDGFARFDFGRSTPGSGTYRFKRQWGATEVQLYWYTIPLGGRRSVTISADDGTGHVLKRLWSQLPVGVTRVLGPQIRRYFTQ